MPVVDSQTTDVGTEESGGATETDNDHDNRSARPKVATAALKSSNKSAQPQGTPNATNNYNSKQTIPSTTNLVPVSPLAVTAVDGQMLSRSAITLSPSEGHHSWEAPQPPSKPPSRQPSAGAMSAASGKRKDSTSGGGVGLFRKRRGSELSAKSRGEDDASYPSRPPSAAGSNGEGRFNLRDLLGAPKLSRKGSASSKKSEKSESGGKAGSTAGESNFSKKYGVISGKLAIGKGATSVVRLAHKWDRTEEKLYAVKVQSSTPPADPPALPLIPLSSRNSGNVERMRLKRSTSRSLPLSFAFRRPFITLMLSRRSTLCKMRTMPGAKSWSFARVETCTLPFVKGG